MEKPPLGGDAHGDSVKFTGTRPFTYSGGWEERVGPLASAKIRNISGC